MRNSKTQLQELLSCYGADISKWPDDVKLLGFDAERDPKLSVLIEEEKRFERIFRERRLEAPSRDLAARIITASLAQAQLSEPYQWFSAFTGLRPAALAAMLVLGFAIGFGMLAPVYSAKDTIIRQSFLEDEGAIL